MFAKSQAVCVRLRQRHDELPATAEVSCEHVLLLCHFTALWQTTPLTFLRLRPWEMLSAVMKAASRCVMAPASPQCGRKRNVFIPRCLNTQKEDSEQVSSRVIWHMMQDSPTLDPAQPPSVCSPRSQLDLTYTLSSPPYTRDAFLQS